MTELPVYHATLEAPWIDYNGHLRDAYYGLAASYAVDAAMDHLGLDAAYRRHTQCTLFTLEMHLHYLHEVKFTDDLQIASSVLDFDGKRIQLGCSFKCSRIDEPVATAEMMLLHVHQGDKPRSAPLPAVALGMLSELKLSSAGVEAFAPRSRRIELKRR